MNRTPSKPARVGVALALAAATLPALAASSVRTTEPEYGTMVLDAAVVRPLGLVATVFGGAAWLVTLPFSALGGNVDEATEKLVLEPARFTFVRPLGDL